MFNNIKDKVVGEPAKETKPAPGNFVTDTAGKASEMFSGAAKTTGDAAIVGKDNTIKFVQGAGEQVKGAALGAHEAVKNTLGMGAPATEEKK